MKRFLTSIARQANGLNLLMTVVVAMLAVFTFLPLYRMGASFSLPVPKGDLSGGRQDQGVNEFNPSDYAVLVQQNLFHPERKLPSPSKKEETALPRPDITLYGTYITSDVKLAFIEEKSLSLTSPGRGQRQAVLKLGEKVLGFELKRVEPDRIVLMKGKETMTVTLEDKRQRSGGTGVANQSSHTPARDVFGQQFNSGQAGSSSGRPVTSIPALPFPPR